MRQKKIKRAFVYQRDSSDCGPACLLSVLRYYGGEDSLQHLREICGTTLSGTSLLGLSRAANLVGFKSKGAEANSIQEITFEYIPCILTVRNEDNTLHFIIFYGNRDGKAIISDPAKGISYVHIEELERIWTHNCLLLEPCSHLKSKKEKVIDKKKWFSTLLSEDKSLIWTSIILGLFIAGINIIMSVFSQIFIDKIAPSHNTSILILGMSILLFFLITQVIISAIRNRILISQGYRFNVRTVSSFLQRILWLPKSFFDSHSTGDMVARLNDTKRIQNVISSLFGEMTINLFMGIVSLLIVCLYSWQIGIICFLCAPIFFFIISSFNKKIRCQQRDVMSSYADSESNFINTISGISDIINYSKQKTFLSQNIYKFSIYQQKNYTLGKTKIKINILSGISSVFIQILIVSIGAYFVFNNSLTVGAFIAVIGITGTLFTSISLLAFALISINEAVVAFDRMYEVAESYGQESEQTETIKPEAIVSRESSIIKINNLTFRFTGKPLLLKGVSAHLEKGKINSIVGPSGTGKSTICQLINRYYKPSSGTIQLSGTNIEDIPINDWRDNTILLTHQPFIIPGTILDNICFDIPKDALNITSCIEQCGLNDLLASFPDGLNTYIVENGKNISSGQKQIIAFIRAILKQRDVIILDEATDNLDYSNERLIFKYLNMIKNKTIILFVTHRMEVVRQFCDNIIVLENGIVSASGTHNALMSTANYYSNYWYCINNENK